MGIREVIQSQQGSRVNGWIKEQTGILRFSLLSVQDGNVSDEEIKNVIRIHRKLYVAIYLALKLETREKVPLIMRIYTNWHHAT